MSERTKSSNENYPIIVHCHLRWDGVWQRPQQFLSRLSASHRVLFVEGPLLVENEEAPSYKLNEAPGYPNVTVMQTFFPAKRFQDGAWVDSERAKLLQEALRGPLAGKFEKPVQWFYDPMAVSAHVDKFNEIAVVYDCMDELSQFKFAPPEIISRERELLRRADVVFTGGRKMWESKKRHAENVHFYGCGVDVNHFGKARLNETPIPEDLAKLKKPLLGYFGVVDERMDYELVRKLAEAADWNVVIVGPSCKVDPASFPKNANIHWLGRREYAQLPQYTKGFDVCLMPFAMNEATEYINPTKALEYMATGKPIVSTPVPDVVSNFGTVVKIAQSHEEFVELCKREASQPDQAAIKRGLLMADENQWEVIVSRLEGHIEDALNAKKGKAGKGAGEIAAV